MLFVTEEWNIVNICRPSVAEEYALHAREISVADIPVVKVLHSVVRYFQQEWKGI